MNPYQYSPLLPKPNSVRLLRLRAGDKAEIRVQIYDYFIDSSRPTHEYEALSYVWGDASQTKRIIVEDRLGGSELGYLDITLNLHTALCRLRNPGLDRFLWVDAVCINQSDIKERDRQVQLMVKIYASATRVIVWLGEMANESDWVIKMIRNAARAAQRKLGVRVWPTPSKENERDQNLEKWRDAHTSKMLLAFLSRPWFRRVWVLQEVAAAQSILILCGREELPGQAFSRGLDNLQVLHNLQNARLKNQIQAIIYLIDWIIDPAHYSNLGILPLGELVDMFQVHEATDRRDKVYALLAMSSQDLERTFRVDYNIVWSVLFDRLVKSIFGNAVEVMTWNNRERALIRTEGGVLGRITGVERGCGFSMQTLHIKTRELWTCQSSTHAEETTRRRMAWTIECSVQNSANVIQADDILVYLRGAKYPSIIRLSYDHFKIIAAVARPQLFRIPAMDWDGNWEDFSELMPTTAKDLTLLWDWEWSETAQDAKPALQQPSLGSIIDRHDVKGEDKELIRLSNVACILEDLEDHATLVEMAKLAREYVIPEEHKSEAVQEALAHFRKLDKILPQFETYLGFKFKLAVLESPENIARRRAMAIEFAQKDYDASGWGRHHTLREFKLFLQEEGKFNMDLLDVLSLAPTNHNQITSNFDQFEPEEMELLQALVPDQIWITEETIKQLVGYDCTRRKSGKWPKEWLDKLLCLRPPSLRVTEGMLMSAARNAHYSSASIMFSVLLKHCSEIPPITPQVLEEVGKLSRDYDQRKWLLSVLLGSDQDPNMVYELLNMAIRDWCASSEALVWKDLFMDFHHMEKIEHFLEHTDFCQIAQSHKDDVVLEYLYLEYISHAHAISKKWKEEKKPLKIKLNNPLDYRTLVQEGKKSPKELVLESMRTYKLVRLEKPDLFHDSGFGLWFVGCYLVVMALSIGIAYRYGGGSEGVIKFLDAISREHSGDKRRSHLGDYYL